MEFKNFDWSTIMFFVGYQLILLVTLPFYFYFFTPRISMIIALIILFTISMLCITAGYHRLYSHKAYKANRLVEIIILFFTTLSVQRSALRWCCAHRLHHQFVDKEGDPHNINEGFMHAHMFWICRKKEQIDEKVIPDLMENKLLVFQHKYCNILALASNVSVFLLFGWLLNDFIGAFVLAVFTRLFLTHHATFFVNSLAHTWGGKNIFKGTNRSQ